MRYLKRGWWWLLDYLYAGWFQLVSAFRRRPPETYAHGDRARPAIVLLPGVYESWLFLEPAARRLNAAGFRVFSVPGLGKNTRSVPESARLVGSALAALHERYGVQGCIVLAHSKGGLIGKRLMVEAAGPDPAGPVEILGMVAIGTPFSGSRYARYMLPPTLRHFSPRDPELISLHAQTAVNAKVVSIYPEFDPHIPGGSALPGALNVRLPVSGHFRTLGQEPVLAAVENAVRTLAGEPTP